MSVPVRQTVVTLPDYSYVAVQGDLMARLRPLVEAAGLCLRPVPTAAGAASRYTLVPAVVERRRGTPEELSDRELAVLRMVAVGLPTHQIAAQLQVATETVKTNLFHAFRKLGAQTRAHAVHLAHQRGILAASDGES